MGFFRFVPGFPPVFVRSRPEGAAFFRLVARVSVLMVFCCCGSALAQDIEGLLGNPADGGYESGIGLVSGFHCDAETIEVQFDDGMLMEAAYGTSRLDTEGICGDSDNGFGFLWNYNILGDGQHTVRVYADGEEFDHATFAVNTLGEEFVRGLDMGIGLIALDVDKDMRLTWQESKQGFVISHVEEADFTLDDLLFILGGTWSGQWNAPGLTGPMSMTFGGSQNDGLIVTELLIESSPCAATNSAPSAPIDINDPFFWLPLTDGSLIELGLLVTENISMVGGTFYYDSGPCEGAEGMFQLFRN